MKLASQGFRQVFDRWISASARAMAESSEHFARPRRLDASLQEGGAYEVAGVGPLMLEEGIFIGAKDRPPGEALRGARVNLDLPPSMFLFRELDFPAKALDFL